MGITDNHDTNLDCPPYNDELAPSDYHFFGYQFCNFEEVEMAFHEYHQMQKPNFQHDRILKTMFRYDECIDEHRDYGEK